MPIQRLLVKKRNDEYKKIVLMAKISQKHMKIGGTRSNIKVSNHLLVTN